MAGYWLFTEVRETHIPKCIKKQTENIAWKAIVVL
jgi:hypothetical protein